MTQYCAKLSCAYNVTRGYIPFISIYLGRVQHADHFRRPNTLHVSQQSTVISIFHSSATICAVESSASGLSVLTCAQTDRNKRKQWTVRRSSQQVDSRLYPSGPVSQYRKNGILRWRAQCVPRFAYASISSSEKQDTCSEIRVLCTVKLVITKSCSLASSMYSSASNIILS